MSEQEEKKNTEEASGGQSIAPRGETLPNEAAQMPSGTPPEETVRTEEKATVRYRPRRAQIRMVGVAIAVFVLLAAILLCCMAGAQGSGDPDESTAESTGESESGTDSGEEVRDLYEFDPSSIPEGHIAFRPADLSGNAAGIVNESDHSFDLASLLARYGADGGEEAQELSFTEPLVLILHTHTTEGYSADGAVSWNGEGELARSKDVTQNVAAAGAVLAEALNGAGIPTLHCTVLHDVDGTGEITNSGSYDRAAETVEGYLAEYPTIRYVIDLHRNTVLDENGNLLRAVTEINGKETAQIMAVAGSGEGYDWESNLALALALTEKLNAESPTLCRAPVLKGSELNQSLAVHSLTLEIGTAANSLAEAENAVVLAADALAELIRAIEATEG